MSDHLPRTNRWLIALSVILCLILGGIFTRSSAVTSQADAISDAGAFVSEDQDSAEFTSEETLTDSNDNFTDSSSGKLFGRTSSDSSETSPGGPALSTDISPEASEGSWASSGSNWMFLVDDKPYTGWFTDTDGKQYYMDETGIMQTGWTDIGKKRYYFDMDGILQTGTVIIDKKTYELDTDGSLKDYTPKKNPRRRNLQVSQTPLTSPVHLRQRSRSPLLLMMVPVLLQTVFWTVWKKIMQRQLSLWWVLRLPVFRTK